MSLGIVTGQPLIGHSLPHINKQSDSYAQHLLLFIPPQSGICANNQLHSKLSPDPSYPFPSTNPREIAMAATQKLYPRGTVKRIVKAHAGRNISKNADVLVRALAQQTKINIKKKGKRLIDVQIFLDYMLFMQEYDPSLYKLVVVWTDDCVCDRLMREASIRARKAGEKGISARSVRRVTEVRSSIHCFACIYVLGHG
jgi:hypothetical protein